MSISQQSIDYFREFPHAWYVYFMRNGDTVKIGASAKPIRRFDCLQAGCSGLLVLTHTIRFHQKKAAFHAERWLKHAFRDYNIRGEWFDICILHNALMAFPGKNLHPIYHHEGAVSYPLGEPREPLKGIEDELNSCPFCGCHPEVNFYSGKGMSITCCVSMRIEKLDYLTALERETWDTGKYRFSSRAEKRLRILIINAWNSRA